MRERLAVVGAIAALTLLSYFQFPGHTYLQADTQIYIPILEHLWNPAALPNDLIVERPHVSFTLYDEIAIALRRITGLPFHDLLAGQQIVTRALGIWGLYLIASSAGLPVGASLLCAAIVSLGATISGPSVLSFEYEPTPRSFAMSLVFLAIGLAAQGRDIAGAVAGSAAFLLHAPTTYPFWAVYLIAAVWRRKFGGLAILAGAALLLWIAARGQAGATQAQTFFARIDPQQEALQRMRASYIWISIWWRDWVPHYIFLYAMTLAALARLRKAVPLDLRWYAAGLPLIGLLSMPGSYLMLETMKLAVAPQFQPMRAVLFITMMAGMLSTIAACVAARSARYAEAALWFCLAYLIPANNRVLELPAWNRVAVVCALSGLAVLAARSSRRWAIAAVAGAAFFAIPICGKVTNYAALHNAALAELCAWGRASTPPAAMFLFPDAGRELYPGVFRAEALRSLYVDWKAGGQVNYFRDFGEQWQSRWQEVTARPFTPADIARYQALGIDYIVLKPEHKLAGATPVFENPRFVGYAIARQQTP